MIGIYIIKSNADNKIYIGQSRNIEQRFRQHKSHLRHGYHENTHLQRAWDKYGESNFTFSIIEECLESELNVKEKYWVDYYGGYDSETLYNLKDAGDYQMLSEESIEKVRIANTGKVRSEEQRRRYSECRKGIVFSEEHCRHISESKKGNTFTKGYKKIEKDGKIKRVKPDDLDSYLSNGWVLSHRMDCNYPGHVPWNKGKKMDKEYCERISKATKEAMSREEVKQKLRKKVV